jgi:hypothetical protein
LIGVLLQALIQKVKTEQKPLKCCILLASEPKKAISLLTDPTKIVEQFTQFGENSL